MAKTTETVVEEIAALRKRVERQYPSAAAEDSASLPLVDLLPLFHARDAADGKVAAIGKVNPRPPGPLNGLIQAVKRQVARALGWFIRDQVDFNYATVRALTETMEALNAVNRALVAAGGRLEAAERSHTQLDGALLDLRLEADAHLRKATDELGTRLQGLRAETQDAIADAEAGLLRQQEHFQRENEARRQSIGELRTDIGRMQESARVRAAEREREDIRLLRTLADVQNAFMQRIALLDTELRQAIERRTELAEERVQSAALTAVAETRGELEGKVHEELRLLRQRVGAILAREGSAENLDGAARNAAHALAPPQAYFDALRFSDRFRGTPESVREKLRVHVGLFEGQSPVLDLGCGRGEFLGLLAEAGIEAIGVEADPELVLIGEAAGHRVVAADLFAYLETREPESAGGIFSAHVIEHMTPSDLARLVALSWRVLRPGGLLVFETPNPACLAIFATYFYLDPTHVRPVPSELARYLLEEKGFRDIQVTGLHPAEADFESLKPLPEGFRQQFFGCMDYAVTARKP